MSSTKNILIVDDDKFLLDMYAIKFRENKYEVQTAMSGADAISLFNDDTKKIDVMLLDIVMPGLDGFQVLDSIKDKKKEKGAAVIVLSNLGQKEDIDRGLSLGADGYIIKAGSTPSEVVSRVEEILNK